MSETVEILRLREVYHHLFVPPSAANEVRNVTRASARVFQCSMFDSSPGGNDGGHDFIPLLGDKQEL
jgi:hypothetical protein